MGRIVDGASRTEPGDDATRARAVSLCGTGVFSICGELSLFLPTRWHASLIRARHSTCFFVHDDREYREVPRRQTFTPSIYWVLWQIHASHGLSHHLIPCAMTKILPARLRRAHLVHLEGPQLRGLVLW